MIFGVIERTERSWRVRFYKKLPGGRLWLAAEVHAPWRAARGLLLGVLLDEGDDGRGRALVPGEREQQRFSSNRLTITGEHVVEVDAGLRGNAKKLE